MLEGFGKNIEKVGEWWYWYRLVVNGRWFEESVEWNEEKMQSIRNCCWRYESRGFETTFRGIQEESLTIWWFESKIEWIRPQCIVKKNEGIR